MVHDEDEDVMRSALACMGFFGDAQEATECRQMPDAQACMGFFGDAQQATECLQMLDVQPKAVCAPETYSTVWWMLASVCIGMLAICLQSPLPEMKQIDLIDRAGVLRFQVAQLLAERDGTSPVRALVVGGSIQHFFHEVVALEEDILGMRGIPLHLSFYGFFLQDRSAELYPGASKVVRAWKSWNSHEVCTNYPASQNVIRNNCATREGCLRSD